MCKVDIKNNNSQIFKQLFRLKSNKTKKKYDKLIDIILNIDFLEKCYLRVKSNLRSFTSSSDCEILDGKHLKFFQKVSSEIKNGIYKPKPSRIIHIEKKNSKEKRRLITNSIKDKIIKEGLRAILSKIYKPLFSNYSYGFSQNKGVNNALKYVKSWKDISWLICLNIEKRFDKIHKEKLMNLLKLQIDDQRFFELINKFFNLKLFDVTLKTGNTIESVMQDSILSLILFNIYLNEFDNFVESLMLKFFKSKRWVSDQKHKSVIDLYNLKNKTVFEKNKKFKLTRNQKIINNDLKDPDLKKIKYARYADDFIIGVSCEKNFAKQIINKVKVFLKTQLHLGVSQEKNGLISIIHRQGSFLGFFIKKTLKHFNPVISQNLKSKEKRVRVLKRLKYEFITAERQELKKTKNNLKRAIFKSLTKNQKYKNVGSDLIDKVAQLVAKERHMNPSCDKPFFSDSTLKSIMFTNKSDIPKDVLNNFTSFQKSIDFNLETIHSEIHLAKIEGKFKDKSGQKQKVFIRQVDPSIQIYAPTTEIKQGLKSRGVISKKGKPLALNFMVGESDKIIIRWYAFIAQYFLIYYSCADNFYKVKSIINYQIRWSMYYTLAKKHKMSLSKLFSVYGQEFEHKTDLQDIFPLKSKVASRKKAFLLRDLPLKFFDSFNQFYFKRTKIFYKKCPIKNCINKNTRIHYICALER